MRMQLRTLHRGVLGVFNELKRNSPECLQNAEGMRVERRKGQKVHNKGYIKQTVKLYLTITTGERVQPLLFP